MYKAKVRGAVFSMPEPTAWTVCDKEPKVELGTKGDLVNGASHSLGNWKYSLDMQIGENRLKAVLFCGGYKSLEESLTRNLLMVGRWFRLCSLCVLMQSPPSTLHFKMR